MPSYPLPNPDLGAIRVALNRARDAAGLTYDDLAERTGLARNTVWHVLSGKTEPTVRTLILLARAIGVSLDDLTKDA